MQKPAQASIRALGWMLDFGFAISTIMVATAPYLLIAIVLLQPALTGPRAAGGEPGLIAG